MATLAAILDAIADQIRDQLATVTDIDVCVEPRAFAAATVPAIDMFHAGPELVANVQGFGEILGAIPIIIRVRVSPADLYSGEDLLLAFVDDEDPLSIVQALAYDETFGGVTSTIVWDKWSGYTDFGDPGSDGYMVGETLVCQVVKARS